MQARTVEEAAGGEYKPVAELEIDGELWASWDEAVEEVGEGTARLWGLYMAGCRIGFERNIVQLHHVLGVKLDDKGRHELPLRPWWDA